MAQIDYYFTLLSPFTYLAGDELERIAEARGATIVYRPCDLARVFEETGGVPLPRRHPSRQEYRLQELERIARRRGLPITLRPAHFPTDPLPGARAVIAAQVVGADAGAVARRLLAQLWAEDRDIAAEDCVDEALAAAGLARENVAAEMEAADATYAANTDDALANGVFGSPFYVVGEARFFGQDRLDYLDEHLGRV